MKIKTRVVSEGVSVSLCEIASPIEISDAVIYHGLHHQAENVRSENRRHEIITEGVMVKELFGENVSLAHRESGAPYLVEKGEDFLTSGIREMKEETGLTLEPLSVDSCFSKPFFTTIGMTDESCATVYGYASGTPCRDYQEGSEDIEIVLADKEEVKRILPNLRVVARSLPQDKSRLVRLSQELDLVVGMTGDGVNDAPALKKADVGFAMGSGTEVSKEASDIVILDDNFKSISRAILFGRTIFKSIRKFIIFQLTVNICAVSLSIIGPFIGVDTPVTVIQMLWINMVMDTLAGIAFAYEPPLLEYMYEKPKKKNEPIINRYMKDEIIFTGAYSAILCVIFLKLPWIHHLFRSGINDKYLMTAFFGLFIFMGIFNSFNARTHRLNLFAHLYQNRVFIIVILFILFVQVNLIYFGGSLFRTFGLTLYEFIIMLLFSMTVIPVDWMRKLYLRSKGIIGGV